MCIQRLLCCSVLKELVCDLRY